MTQPTILRLRDQVPGADWHETDAIAPQRWDVLVASDLPCMIWTEEREAFWRGGGEGYTLNPDEAGIYTIQDARDRLEPCKGKGHHLGVLREPESYATPNDLAEAMTTLGVEVRPIGAMTFEELAARWAELDTKTADTVPMPPANAEALKVAQQSPWWQMSNAQRDRVQVAVSEALGEAMDCTRVWSAWSYGTMGEDDFEIIAEDPDRVDEIAQEVVNGLGLPAWLYPSGLPDSGPMGIGGTAWHEAPTETRQRLRALVRRLLTRDTGRLFLHMGPGQAPPPANAEIGSQLIRVDKDIDYLEAVAADLLAELPVLGLLVSSAEASKGASLPPPRLGLACG